MSDNFQLNLFTVVGGDISRAVEHSSGSKIKTQILGKDWTPGGAKETLLGYPINLQVRIVGAQSNLNLLTAAGQSAISAGTKLVCTRFKIVPSDDQATQISVVAGFGSSTPSVNGIGIVYSNPGMQNRSDGGEPIFAMGSDGQNLFMTNGAPSGSGFDVLATLYEVPS